MVDDGVGVLVLVGVGGLCGEVVEKLAGARFCYWVGKEEKEEENGRRIIFQRGKMYVD